MRKISLFLALFVIITFVFPLSIFADGPDASQPHNYAVPFDINEDGAYYMVEPENGHGDLRAE